MCDDHGADKPPPRWALLSMFGLVSLTILVAALSPEKSAAPAQQRSVAANSGERVAVRFVDRTRGRIAVIENSTNRTIAILAPNTFGFVRTVMRGMAYNRRRAGEGSEAPFWISRRNGNQFYLTDPKTKRTMHLNAFGLTNAKTFGKLMDAALKQRQQSTSAVFPQK